MCGRKSVDAFARVRFSATPRAQAAAAGRASASGVSRAGRAPLRRHRRLVTQSHDSRRDVDPVDSLCACGGDAAAPAAVQRLRGRAAPSVVAACRPPHRVTGGYEGRLFRYRKRLQFALYNDNDGLRPPRRPFHILVVFFFRGNVNFFSDIRIAESKRKARPALQCAAGGGGVGGIIGDDEK